MNGKAVRVIGAVVTACLLVTAFVGLVVRQPGHSVRSMDLFDAGVWVTNDHEGSFGRLNRAAGALDGGFFPPGELRKEDESTLDVLQDADTVVAVDRNTSTIYPVDVRTAVPLADQGVVIAQDAVLDLRGGTIAALDRATGRIWATRYRAGDTNAAATRLRQLAATTEPLTSVASPKKASGAGPFSDLAVAEDGTVFVADAAGTRVLINPDADSDSGFASPAFGAIGARKAVTVTTVGHQQVIADPVARTVQVGNHAPLKLPRSAGDAETDPPVLQQPGGTAGDVLVATRQALYRLPLTGGPVDAVFTAGTGVPARPAVVRGCGFAAWAGQRAATARTCGVGGATEEIVDRAQSLRRPVLRVNRGHIVINDIASGRLFDVENRKATDDWTGLIRPLRAAADYKGPSKDPGRSTKQPPTITPAVFGARPGRASVLPVLDNVTDLAGRILAVTAISRIEGGTAVIAPDLQTVRFTLDKDAQVGSFLFTADAGGISSTGRVSVRAQPDSRNTAPKHRKTTAAPLWTVPAGGVLTVPVIGSWRDGEGDPLVIAGAETARGSVQPGDGALEVTAPSTPGSMEVTYRVSDGRATSAPARVRVEVQDAQATTRRPATTRPDVVVTEAGRPVQITPLANDIPGSDPTSRDPHLALDGEPAFTRSSSKPLRVDTDLTSGTLTVIATKPGTYPIRYRAAYGTAEPAEGEIRVEVREKAKDRTPVAMPDTASIRGLAPALVDVLGNDRDPAGALLTVQSATASPADALSVAIVGGRWLRLTPTGVATKTPPLVTYSVTNGSEATMGQVEVAMLPGVEEDRITVRSDTATVRAGDSVLAPVLDNDSTLSGSALTLLATVPDAPAPGQLRVTDPLDPGTTKADVGAAYVSGQSIRYLAPAKAASARTINIDYVAQTDTGQSAAGRLTVVVTPRPGPEEVNSLPTPEGLEARVVQGGNVTIPVPTTGHDPDGDSTMVTGLASAPRLGRLVSFSPNSLTYQAYPNFTGSDSFRYAVTDAFGGVAEATVRVSVVPAGDPQPAVPLPDTITAAPGATVTINPLTNDLFAAGDPVRIHPLADHNPHLPADVKLISDTGPITAKVPKVGTSEVIKYGLSGNAGASALSTVTVRAAKGAQIPPRITDHVAKATSVDSTTVDVLADAIDPDGDSSRLRVTSVALPDAGVRGGRITIPVTDAPQAVPYVVTDTSGSSAAAVVYVPAAGSGGPFAVPGASIAIKEGGSVKVDLADLVRSPTGSPVTLADQTDPIITTPAKAFSAKASRTTLTLTAAKGYAGPAALILAVTDRTGADREATPASLVSIPVQIGDDAPILRCPNLIWDLVAGADPVDIDVASVCHVWTADPAAAGRLTFDASWTQPADGVTIAGSGTDRIRLTAQPAARAGTEGEFEVKVRGESSEPARMRVRVTDDLPLPTILPVRLDHVAAGQSVDVDLAESMTSPLPNPAFRVLSASPAGGAAVGVQTSGSHLTLTPAADASGVLTVAVAATDAGAERTVHGTISLSIFGRPDPPTAVAARAVSVADSVDVSWQPGAANGSPIDAYEVSGGGRTQQCAASPCLISGLPLGEPVSFVVRAHNEAGWSDPSTPSPAITIEQVPGPPANFVVAGTGDGSVSLAWGRPSGGTSLTGYRLTWQPGTGGGAMELTAGAGSATVTGLTNGTDYTFTLVATNAAGDSVPVSTSGIPVGPPSAPVIADAPYRDAGDGANAIIDVSWAASAPNGPGTVGYAVRMDGTVICETSGTTCTTPPVAYGSSVTLTVTATNSAGLTADSESVTVSPIGTPDAWSPIAAGETGTGEVTVTFDVPATHGAPCEVVLFVDGTSRPVGTFGPGAVPGQSVTVGELGPGTHTFRLQLCPADGGPLSDEVRVTLVGPLGVPAFAAVSVSGTTVSYTVTVPGGSAGRDGVSLTVSVVENPSLTKTFMVGSEENYSGSFDIGYGATATLQAVVADGSGSNTATADPVTTGPAPTPAGVALSEGPASTCTDTGLPCAWAVIVDAHDFDGTNITCTLNGSGSYQISNGTNTLPSQPYLDSLTVECTDETRESARDTRSPWGTPPPPPGGPPGTASSRTAIPAGRHRKPGS